MILINNEFMIENSTQRFAIISHMKTIDNNIISHHDLKKNKDSYNIKSTFFIVPFLNCIYKLLRKRLCNDVIQKIIMYIAKKNNYMNISKKLNIYINTTIKYNILNNIYLPYISINTNSYNNILQYFEYKYKIHMDIIHFKIIDYLQELLNKKDHFTIDKILDFNKNDFSLFESLS